MHTIEPLIEPVEVEIPNGDVVVIRAAYSGDAPDPSEPFYLPAPEAIFAPLAIPTPKGPAALTLGVRKRALHEGPRRSSPAETVTLATGRFAVEALPLGQVGVDAPAWPVPVPNGPVPASVQVECSFPWASPAGRRDLHIEYCREDGKTGALLMSADTLQDNQDAVAKSFHDFVAANPGLANVLERGMGHMDARIMRFEADRLDRLKDNAAALEAGLASGDYEQLGVEAEDVEELREAIATQAGHLREGAEVIEENLEPFDRPGGFVR